MLIINNNNIMCTGMVTLSPTMVAPVCHVGDPLELTCTAPVQFIRWTILHVNEQGTFVEAASAQINSLDGNQMTEREVNSSTFTFMRTSAPDTSPLISTVSVDSISIGLNGTVVNCSYIANPTTLASTTIQIIDNSE